MGNSVDSLHVRLATGILGRTLPRMNATTLKLDETRVNAALVVHETGAVTSNTNIIFDFEVQSNTAIVNVDVQTNENDKFVAFTDQWEIATWTAEKAQRFRALAVKESLEELPIEEQAELEGLTRLRRSAKNPRNADEILWERRQNRVTNELVQALQNYVQFHEAPHHP
jgi:hypothetical protein